MRRAIFIASALTVSSWGLTAKGQALYVDDFYTTQTTFYRPPTNAAGAGTLGDTQWVAWSNGQNFNQTGFVNITAEAQLSNWGFGVPSDPNFPNPVNSPVVSGGQPGAIFWSPLRDNMVMYTQNSNLTAAAINTSSVRNISFFAQSDPIPSPDNPSTFQTNGWNLHALVEVGGNWYASVNEQQVAEENAKGVWGYFTISTAATQWFPVILNDDSNAAFFSGPVYTQNGTTPIPLPGGAIQGAGLGTGVGALYYAPGGSTTDTPPHNPNLIITDFQLSHTPAAVVWGNGYAAANSLTPADGTTWDVGNNLNWGTGSFPEIYASPYVDGDGTVANQGGAVIFNDSNNGHYAVTLNTVVHPGAITVSNSSGDYTFSGSGGIGGNSSLTKTGSGSLTIGTANTFTGATNVNVGTLALTTTGSITGSAVTVGTTGGSPTVGTLSLAASTTGMLVRNLASLNIVNGAANVGAAPTATQNTIRSVLVTPSLTIAALGKLDLANNDMIVKGTTAGAVQAQLATGFNAHVGYWNGSGGIVSTSAAGDSRHLTTLGYLQSGGSAFDGVSTTTSDTIVKYTYYGDADLNGIVNGADYQQIDLGFGTGATGWAKGDFNYDGVVNGSDFALIDNTFNQITATGAAALGIIASPSAQIAAPATSEVPEPATLGLVGFGAIGLLGHRRRRTI